MDSISVYFPPCLSSGPCGACPSSLVSYSQHCALGQKPSLALTAAVLACQAHSGFLGLTVTWLASSRLQDEQPHLPHRIRALSPANMSMTTLTLAGALPLTSLHSRGRMDPLQKTIYHHQVIQKIHKAKNAATAFSGTCPGESGACGLHWRPTNSSPN